MLIAHVAEEVAAAFNFAPIIAAGTAFSVFLVLGIICFSYRDVYNRHSDKTGGDSHSTGH